MEDEHRYIPTPTRDSRIEFSNQTAHYYPRISGVGESQEPTLSAKNRGRKKFINSRNFCTLATKLCNNSEQQPEEVFCDEEGCEHSTGNIHSSHIDAGIDNSQGSDIEITNPHSSANPGEDNTSNSYQSKLRAHAVLSQSTTPFGEYQSELRKELRVSENHQMGTLLKNPGVVFDKTDSLGFSSSDGRFFQEDNATNGRKIDLSQIISRKEKNVFPNTNSSNIKNIQKITSDPESQICDTVSVLKDSCQGHVDVGSISHQLKSAQYDQSGQFSLEQAMSPELMLTESEEVSENSVPQSDYSTFQNPLSCSSPTKVAPTFRRQLSKRKSDVFEAFLPESAHVDLDDEEADDDDDFFSLGGFQGGRSDPCTPTTPKTRRLENYDPYQIFEVQHTPCLILSVRILRGRNITLGFQDYYDTPDPYVNLVLRSSPEGKKSTTVKENDPNPVWDETFTFYINFTQANILEITLMESNSLWFDQLVGTIYFDLVNIREMDKPQMETFVFNKVSQVDIEFKLEFDRNPTLRYSLCLSPKEKEFMEQRKEKMLEGMRRLLGDEDGPLNIDEVPTIAVIGSGGGFRAMTGYSGVFKALFESGILDCTMYACGLSGSSWLLSTLYSHPKWPNLDMGEFLDEMKHNIDKSLLRFLNASTMYAYIKFMIQKRKDGQPVSFTDIFGRMVGETLLKGRMESTLSGQREKIKGGAVPMPLYTCVHVKKDVPARSFQEWVEFSPYEIGLPKYGTFMDSELFGSKFFMGKLVKQYKEQPLHFLQGIWGSAFCILFKRLLEDNRRIDPVEMVRQEMGKQLDEAGQESSSDCSDDDINVEDSMDSMDGEDVAAQNGGIIKNHFLASESDVVNASKAVHHRDSVGSVVEERRISDVEECSNEAGEYDEKNRQHNQSFNNQISIDNINDNEEDDSAYEGEEEDCDEDEDKTDQSKFLSQRMRPRGSVEMKRGYRYHQSSKDSASPENDLTQEHIEVPQFSATSALELNQTPVLELNQTPILELNQNSQGFENDMDQMSDRKKSVNWGACPTLGKKLETGATNQRRQAFVSATSVRKSRSGSKSYWNRLLKKVFESKSWELLSTRRGRAAVIHNFMRGLSLQQSYPLSPFTPVEERVKAGDEFDGIFEMHPTSVKHIYMVDAGLTFNSPFPLVLRPQREVDIILSFDFSARDSDNSQPFKELLLAEKWAKLNRLPFPPIDTSVYEREGMKELYIFRHPTDPHCPVVFHFVLINKRFKYYKKPDVPRETKEEFEFAEFDIFDDPKAAYSTFNFTYAHKSYERLSQLMEFNTLLHIDDIKQVIKDVIKKKREGPPRLPIQSKDIKLLHMKSVQEMRKLRRFISRMESRSSLYSGTSPSTPYFTPSVNSETNINPFFPKWQQELSQSPPNDNTISSPTDRLCESLSRNNRVKKHLHPNDIFSEFEELNYIETASKLGMKKSNPSQNSSSFESASDLTPDNSDHFHHLGHRTSQQINSHVNVSTSVDECDGSSVQVNSKCEFTNFPESNTCVKLTNSTVPANPPSDNTLTKIKTGLFLNQNTNKWSPLTQQTTKTESTSLGYGSLGADMSIDRTRRDCSNADLSSAGTPETGTFSIESNLSENLGFSSSDRYIIKGKVKRDPPPNPFFSKALFMRSSQSSTSSSNSSASSLTGSENTSGSYHLSPQTSESPNSPRNTLNSKLVGRLNSRTPQLSPLVVSSNNKLKNIPKVQPVASPTTPDIFSLAPEAFKIDGTPVFDSQQAKMFYEGAKSKRKFFRRQSTVSSLKSISLDENDESCDTTGVRDHESCDDEIQRTPNKKMMTHSDTEFSKMPKTCHQDRRTLPDASNRMDTSKAGKPQTVKVASDEEVQFDSIDLSQFTGINDGETENGSQTVSPHEALHSEIESPIWFDAEDNAV